MAYLTQKIYFAGSIRGGREYAELYAKIIEELGRYGKVLTEHVGDNQVFELEKKKTDKAIYDTDIDWLKQADAIVAEVSINSLGVGYELGYAVCLNKKIICLYNNKSTTNLSAMITGCESINIVNYSSIDDLKTVFKNLL